MRKITLIILLLIYLTFNACVGNKKVTMQTTYSMLMIDTAHKFPLWTIIEDDNRIRSLIVLSEKDSSIYVLVEKDSVFEPIRSFVLDDNTKKYLFAEEMDKAGKSSYFNMMDSNTLLITANAQVFSVYDIQTGKMLHQQIMQNDDSVFISELPCNVKAGLFYDNNCGQLIFHPLITRDILLPDYPMLAGKNIYTGENQLYAMRMPKVKEFTGRYSNLEYDMLYCYAEGNYVAAWSNSQVIFSFNPSTQKIDSFYVKSKHYTPYPKQYDNLPPLDSRNSLELMQFKIHSMYYDYYNTALVYDKYRKVFYRYFSPAQKEKSKDGLKNDITTKLAGVTIFDKNFNYIGDYLSENQFFPYTANSVVTSKGICRLVEKFENEQFVGYEVVTIKFNY